MNGIDRILGACTNVMTSIAGLLMMAMMAHIVLDVLFKWLLNSPIDGTLEIVSHYYMVGLIYLPLSYVQLRGSHIVAEIFTQNLKARTRAGLEGVIGVFLFIYVVLFVWTSGGEAIEKTAENEFLEATESFIVIWPTRWFVTVGFAIMGLYAIYQALRNLKSASSGEAPPGPIGTSI
ncbi:MAG: TRAP transporter small permease [Rhodospirillales bacterium]|jgi:TRAP-type C4-dicarboxylate transport system permease small subunit|nr:TRAP transporter small permease [Rhodospirillales bacterium]